MIKTDPIRMSDYHHRAVAIAPIEVARQFRISAFLAAFIIVAAALISAQMLLAPSHTAQALPATAVVQAS